MKDRKQLQANRPQWAELHPLITWLTLALAIWSIAAMWIFFDHSYYGPLLFAVVTFLVGMFVALPWILLHSRRDPGEHPPSRFRDWTRGELDTASGPLICTLPPVPPLACLASRPRTNPSMYADETVDRS